jgi:hypothetical protein
MPCTDSFSQSGVGLTRASIFYEDVLQILDGLPGQ